MALFALPKLAPDAVGGLTGSPASRLPRALVALVPFTQANGPAAPVKDLVPAGAEPPFAETEAPSPTPARPAEAASPLRADAAPPAAEPDPVPPRKLAERMVEDG